MSHLRIKLSALLMTLIMPAGAMAYDVHWHYGTETTTAYSGWAGAVESSETGALSGQQLGIMGISWAEEGDAPCRLGLYARDIEDGSEWVHYNTIFNHCDGTGGNWKYAHFIDNPRYFVRGLAVCSSQNDNNYKRLKGIKIIAAKVWLTQPEVESLTTTVIQDHTNCGTWHETVYCPGGTIAYGINVHRDGDEITGLALKCRDIDF